MSEDLVQAAKVLNDSIKAMQGISGGYPKDYIQKLVEQTFIDGNYDFYRTSNVISYIENGRYQKTAETHLNYIKKYGTRHLTDPRMVNKKADKTNSFGDFFLAYFLNLIMVWPVCMFPITAIAKFFPKEDEEPIDDAEFAGSTAAFVTAIFLISLAL